MKSNYGVKLQERNGWFHLLYTVPKGREFRFDGKRQVRITLGTKDREDAFEKRTIELKKLHARAWSEVSDDLTYEAGMSAADYMGVKLIGLDLAKNTIQVHGAGADGSVIFRRKVSSGKLLAFLSGVDPCMVAMEACAGSHHWGREISKLGHQVKLIAPAYVKPFVKRQKNDAADAEAICEAALRPTMRFVAVKSEAKQASAMV